MSNDIQEIQHLDSRSVGHALLVALDYYMYININIIIFPDLTIV